MKILFLTDNFPPEVNAPATRTYEHCLEWVRMGEEVTIITCAPNFPHGKVYEGYKNKLYQTEYIDGIKVIRVWSYVAANKGFAKRILDYISFSIMAFLLGLFVKTDIIIATSPQFFTAIAGRWLSFFKRKKWIMEVRDLWPESIKAVGAINGDSHIYKFLVWVELRLYKNADLIVVVTDTFKNIISSKGINTEKIKVVKNGVRLDKFKPLLKDKSLVIELGLADKFVVGYIGTHGMAHALEFIAKSTPLLDENIRVIFLGDGAEKKKILNLKEELKLDKLIMLPFVAKSEIQRYISILDVALVNLKKSETFKTVIPSKIFENAAMEKPILLGVEGESKEIIESFNAGICFEPENKDDFIDKLNLLYCDKELYNSCIEGCKTLAQNFKRTTLANKMLTEIK